MDYHQPGCSLRRVWTRSPGDQQQRWKPSLLAPGGIGRDLQGFLVRAGRPGTEAGVLLGVHQIPGRESFRFGPNSPSEDVIGNHPNLGFKKRERIPGEIFCLFRARVPWHPFKPFRCWHQFSCLSNYTTAPPAHPRWHSVPGGC